MTKFADTLAAELADAWQRHAVTQHELQVICAEIKLLERLQVQLPTSEPEPAPERIPLSGANFPIQRKRKRDLLALSLEAVREKPGHGASYLTRAIENKTGQDTWEPDVAKNLRKLKAKEQIRQADDDTWWPAEMTVDGGIYTVSTKPVEARTASKASPPVSDTGKTESPHTAASLLAKTPPLKHEKPPMSREALLDFIRRGGNMGIGENQLTLANATEADVDALVEIGAVTYDAKERRYHFVEPDAKETME